MTKTNASIRGSHVSGEFIPLRPGELVASGLGMRFWDAYLSSIEFDEVDDRMVFREPGRGDSVTAISFDGPKDQKTSEVATVAENSSLIRHRVAQSLILVSALTVGWMVAGTIGMFAAVIALLFEFSQTEKDFKTMTQNFHSSKKAIEPPTDPTIAYPVDGRFLVLDRCTSHELMKISKTYNNSPILRDLVMNKLDLEDDREELEEWMMAVSSIFWHDKNFPHDAIPLMNDKATAVRKMVVAKAEEKERLDAEIAQVKADEEFAIENERKQVGLRFAEQDFVTALGYAEQYLEIS